MNEAGNPTDNRAEAVPQTVEKIDRHIADLEAEIRSKRFGISRVIRRAKSRAKVAAAEGHTGWVYFISDGHAVKIGYSWRPEYRMADLQAATHRELKLLAQCTGSIKTERELHSRFAELRLSGEWFKPEGGLLDLIELVRRGASLPEADFLMASKIA